MCSVACLTSNDQIYLFIDFIYVCGSNRYMKEDMERMSEKQLCGIHPGDIHWVITVPAIWDDSAKNFMRLAAQKVH